MTRHVRQPHFGVFALVKTGGKSITAWCFRMVGGAPILVRCIRGSYSTMTEY
jgi:hypothetical protein